MSIDVYGRVFRIVDCDDFTRKFYNNEGLKLNTPERIPDDTFAYTRAMIDMKQTPPDEAEQKEYVEVLRGGGRPNKALSSFLENDRKVLSFKILWNDTAYDGGQKFYVLNFFLSDNNVEVKEINEQNTGRFPFPMLMKKRKLAKQPIMTHCPGMSLRKEEYYMPEDLIIGSKINVFGREVIIYDCDAYTRDWYQANLGLN
jgi:EF-hand domain-containing protein 1